MIETARLRLVLKQPEDVRALLEAMSPADREEVSADWVQMVHSADSADPWIHGFSLLLSSDETEVGGVGYKGPPTPEGMVEIAYGIAEEYQGQGYATEAAGAMVEYAFDQHDVTLVRAHTLPQENASTRVLIKCGFQRVAEVIDPEDGLVWRWERVRPAK